MQGRFQEACAEYECALAEDGTNREAKDGVNREAKDGANREAKVLLEMAVKAFRVQCECVCLECPFMLSILHPSQ